MSQTLVKSPTGYILTPSGWVLGNLIISGSSIVGMEGKPACVPAQPDNPYILPGFVDLHVHGAEGVDYSGGEDAIRQFIRFHARSGTVAIAPTTSTSTVDVIERALTNIAEVRANQRHHKNRRCRIGAQMGGHLPARCRYRRA